MVGLKLKGSPRLSEEEVDGVKMDALRGDGMMTVGTRLKGSPSAINQRSDVQSDGIAQRHDRTASAGA